MIVYVDADACPVKEQVYRAAARYQAPVTVVANGPLRVPLAGVTLVRVGSAPDAADDWIAARVAAGDLVVTGDIPLAARVLEAGAVCLDFRGNEFTARMIGDAMAVRELHRYLRDLGELSGGPAAFSPRDRSRFASKIDAVLNRLRRESSSPPL